MLGLNRLKGRQPLDNWILNGNTDINKQYKTCRFTSTKKKHTHYHKNEQHKHGQYTKTPRFKYPFKIRICKLNVNEVKALLKESLTFQER